jgi:hypothetical protein
VAISDLLATRQKIAQASDHYETNLEGRNDGTRLPRIGSKEFLSSRWSRFFGCMGSTNATLNVLSAF